MSDNQHSTESETMVRDLTTGSVPALLFSFAAPLFAVQPGRHGRGGTGERRRRKEKTRDKNGRFCDGCFVSVRYSFSALILLFPEEVCSFFTGDPEVLAEDALIILPIVLNTYGAATRAPAFAFINGSGNSRINLLVAVLDGMIARVGLATFFGFVLGLRSQGFWYGDALAGFMPLVIGSVFFVRFLRTKRNIAL